MLVGSLDSQVLRIIETRSNFFFLNVHSIWLKISLNVFSLGNQNIDYNCILWYLRVEISECNKPW